MEEIEVNEEVHNESFNRRVRWYRDWILFGVMGVVFSIDQLTKMWIIANLYRGESILEAGTFRITHTVNTGGAFGLFANQSLFLILSSFVGIGILIALYRNQPFSGTLVRLSLGLQLGGALGNLVDRIRVGYVVDFIQLGFWPVFNLADSSIVVGIITLAWLIISGKSKEESTSTTETSQEGFNVAKGSTISESSPLASKSEFNIGPEIEQEDEQKNISK